MAFMSVQLKVEDPVLTVPVLRSTDETLLYLQQHVEMAKKAKQHSLKPHLCNTIPRSTQSGLISGVGTQTGRAGRGRNCLTDQWDANPVHLGYNWKAMGSLDVLTEWCVVQKALVEIKAWEWKQDELQEWISSWELALAVHSCCASQVICLLQGLAALNCVTSTGQSLFGTRRWRCITIHTHVILWNHRIFSNFLVEKIGVTWSNEVKLKTGTFTLNRNNKVCWIMDMGSNLNFLYATKIGLKIQNASQGIICHRGWDRQW